MRAWIATLLLIALTLAMWGGSIWAFGDIGILVVVISGFYFPNLGIDVLGVDGSG